MTLKPRVLSRAALLAGWCMTLILRASAQAPEEDAPWEVIPGTKPNGVTIIGVTPWDPVQSGRNERVIYGTDDRYDLYDVSDPEFLQWSKSVCAVVRHTRLEQNGDGSYTLLPLQFQYQGLPPCSNEPFRTQPVVASCTAFLVGYDLVATAAHCYGSVDVGYTFFVFGYEMLDANTPVLDLPAEYVYEGVEIVQRWYQTSEGDDFALVRLDRPVTAPGAFPLPIRRSGEITNGEAIGMIGHPSGLPMKVAFGPTTQVYDASPVGYFVANLDAYGGNSGSPVFNASTGIVEGILVRGAADFRTVGTCFVSNVHPDSAAGTTHGEDVQKAIRFAEFVPEVGSEPLFDRAIYGCGATLTLRVRDENLADDTLEVTVLTDAGDEEVVVLTRTPGEPNFVGTIEIAAAGAAVVTGDGVLQGNDTDIITAIYEDEETDLGGPETFVNSATLDCIPPVITQLDVARLWPEGFTVTFDTDKATSGRIDIGAACGILTANGASDVSNSHVVPANGLDEGNLYFWRAAATDAADNTTFLPAIGDPCSETQTYYYRSVIVNDDFEPAAHPGWTVQVSTGSDTWTVAEDIRAVSGSSVMRLLLTNSGVQDIRLISPAFAIGDLVEFHHTYAFEAGWDGGMLEITTDGGASWTDLGEYLLEGTGYNTLINDAFGNPLGEVMAWSGGSLGPMERVVVDVRDFVGTRRVAFRFGADVSVLSGGWMVDDFKVHELSDEPPLTAGGHWELFP